MRKVLSIIAILISMFVFAESAIGIGKPVAETGLVYNGSEHKLIADNTGEDYFCNFNESTTGLRKCSDIKWKDAAPDGIDVYYYSDNGSSSYTNEGKITVKIDKFPIDIRWENLEFIYDGTAKIPTPVVTNTDKPNNDGCEIQKKGYQTNAGPSSGSTYEAEAYFDSSECNKNYTINNNKQTFEIKKRDITINWHSDELTFLFDDNYHVPGYDVDNMPSDDRACVLTYQAGKGSQRNANTPGNLHKAIVEFSDNTCKNNYNIINDSIDFTITKITAGITNKPRSKQLTYNGLPQVLIEPGSCGTGSEMYYGLSENGNFYQDYKNANIQKTDVISTDIWYYCKATDNNHNDSPRGKVDEKAEIKPFAMQNLELKLKDAYFPQQTGTVYPTATPITSSSNIDTVNAECPYAGYSDIVSRSFTPTQL